MREDGANRVVNRSGHEDLWEWFGLSRACWLTLPRVLMHSMPDEWQARMAALLVEFDREFPSQPEMCTRVSITDRGGRRMGYPSWLVDYRHPDRSAVNRMRGPSMMEVSSVQK